MASAWNQPLRGSWLSSVTRGTPPQLGAPGPSPVLSVAHERRQRPVAVLHRGPRHFRHAARLSLIGADAVAGAAGSLCEGPAETLIVLRLGVSPTLARSLRSTNSIESMISIARNHSMNVRSWQNGTMALRWSAAGMIEASKQFQRVNGHLHLPELRVALDEYVAAQTVIAVRHDDNVIAARRP